MSNNREVEVVKMCKNVCVVCKVDCKNLTCMDSKQSKSMQKTIYAHILIFFLLYFAGSSSQVLLCK